MKIKQFFSGKAATSFSANGASSGFEKTPSSSGAPDGTFAGGFALNSDKRRPTASNAAFSSAQRTASPATAARFSANDAANSDGDAF